MELTWKVFFIISTAPHVFAEVKFLEFETCKSLNESVALYERCAVTQDGTALDLFIIVKLPMEKIAVS